MQLAGLMTFDLVHSMKRDVPISLLMAGLAPLAGAPTVKAGLEAPCRRRGSNVEFHRSWLSFLSVFALFNLLAGIGFCEVTAAGFVSLEKSSGVWWFKSPAGKPFLSIGANHIEPVYWQSPKNSSFMLERYGPDLFLPDGAPRDGLTDAEPGSGGALTVLKVKVLNEGSPAAEKWAQRVTTNFTNWGFNTFGFHNPLSGSLHAADQNYYVVALRMAVPWGWNMKRSALVRAFKRDPFDIFNDTFVAAVNSKATDLVKAHADDSRVLGYAYTDGPPWTVEDDRGEAAYRALTGAGKSIHPWVLALMSLPAEAKGKQAWLAMMKGRYPSAEKAGATYACNASTWSELAATVAWTSISDPARAAEDSQAFLVQIMRRWYDLHKNAIRKYDRNHLILGDKLNMNRDSKYPEQMVQSLRVMSNYVDVINIQYYAPFEQQRDTLELLYRETQKPILNGDTACNPLWPDNDAENADYYDRLGQTYANEVSRLFSLPYFIGWHHCGYMRGPRLPYLVALKRGDQKAVASFAKQTYRPGFVSEFEEPINLIVKPLSHALADCERLHRASATPDERP